MEKRKGSALFLFYTVLLVLRALLFAACVITMFRNPATLDPRETFGLAHGFNLTDVVFIFMLLDLLTKFFERANISIGSLKQYRRYHIPTAKTFEGRDKGLIDAFVNGKVREFLRGRVSSISESIPSPSDVRKKVSEELASNLSEAKETRQATVASAKRMLNDSEFLDFIHFDEKDLTVEASEKAQLRAKRLLEIAPVIVFWVGGNAAVAVVLRLLGLLSTTTAFMWSVFYFLFDMISVVLWCPIQLWFMRNRCCSTCQIFNWDAIMFATPLVFVRGWYGWTILALSLVVLLRWEIAAAQHPERFDESTNARLTCAQCTERLCQIRGKVTPRRTAGKAGSQG